MNNQFSGLNVNSGVQGQSYTQPTLNSNHNQLNAANITGISQSFIYQDHTVDIDNDICRGLR